MLTIKKLATYPNKTIFASGLIIDNTEGFYFHKSGMLLRWVAVKGGIEDWKIYIGHPVKTYEQIKSNGDKVTMESNIKHLVPCTDEVFALYRY